MAKQSSPAAVPVAQVYDDISRKKFRPVYYLFGEDDYALGTALKDLETAITPLTGSDFDRQSFFGSSSTWEEIVGFAEAFPISGEKKLCVVREAEKLHEKEKAKKIILFERLVLNPPAFLHLMLAHSEQLRPGAKNIFGQLAAAGALFEAKDLKAAALEEWVVSFARARAKRVDAASARVLIELVGEDRALIEMQLEKMFTYLGQQAELTPQVIEEHVAATKEYTVFNLQDAIAEGSGAKGTRVLSSLLAQGEEPLAILGMLNKYFMSISMVPELEALMREGKMAKEAAAKVLGTHPYYMDRYSKARSRYSAGKLLDITNALLEADFGIKTGRGNPELIMQILLGRIFSR